MIEKIYIIDDSTDVQDNAIIHCLDNIIGGTFDFLKKEDLDIISPDDLEDMLSDGNVLCFYHDSLDPENYGGFKNAILQTKDIYAVPISGALLNRFEDGKLSSLDKSTFYAHAYDFINKFIESKGLDYSIFGFQAQENISEIKFPKEFTDLSDNLNLASPNGIDALINTIKEANSISFGINLDKDSKAAMKAAMLIRLSIKELGRGALRPIVFVGSKDIVEYVNEEYSDCVPQKYSGILFTEGVYLVKDINAIDPLSLKSVDSSNYKCGFLDRIKILPLAETGNHTISNHWGAYQMMRHLDIDCPQNDKIENIDAIYLRYLILSTLSEKKIKAVIEGVEDNQSNKVKPIDCTNRKLLLIDDQDKEWLDVLQKFYENSEITVLGKDDFTGDTSPYYTEETKKFLDNNGKINPFDLILLDLRLGGIKEENLSNSEEISGMKILKSLMDKNPGRQIIMFTSSNKAWNMQRAIIEGGCLGYYIKESPLVLKTSDEINTNLENLKMISQLGFDRHFLVTLYSSINHQIKEKIDNLKEELKGISIDSVDARYGKQIKIDYKVDLDEIAKQIELSFSMIKEATKSKIDDYTSIAYAYVSLEQCFEILKTWLPKSKSTEYQAYLESKTNVFDSTAIRIKYLFNADSKSNAFNSPFEHNNAENASVELKDLVKLRNNFMHLNKDLTIEDFNIKNFECLFNNIYHIITGGKYKKYGIDYYIKKFVIKKT